MNTAPGMRSTEQVMITDLEDLPSTLDDPRWRAQPFRTASGRLTTVYDPLFVAARLAPNINAWIDAQKNRRFVHQQPQPDRLVLRVVTRSPASFSTFGFCVHLQWRDWKFLCHLDDSVNAATPREAVLNARLKPGIGSAACYFPDCELGPGPGTRRLAFKKAVEMYRFAGDVLLPDASIQVAILRKGGRRHPLLRGYARFHVKEVAAIRPPDV
jgi:hypothetical protein